MKKLVITMFILLSTSQVQSNDLIIDGTFSGGVGKIQLEKSWFFGSGVCIEFLGIVSRGVFAVVPSCEKGQREYSYNLRDLPISIVPENTKKSYLISFVDTNKIVIQVSKAAIERTKNEYKEWKKKKKKERQEKVNDLIERAMDAPMGSYEKEMLLNEAELLNNQ